MVTYQDLEQYYKELDVAFGEEETSFHYNHDRSHNATVMRFMLDTSLSINMYCGQLSVFRKGFFEHIQKDNQNKTSEKLESALKDSFINFLAKKDASLTIIFESYAKECLDDLICKDEFIQGIENNKIHLYKLDDSLSFKKDINHFSYTDSQIVRLEQDKIKHSAICIIKENDIYKSTKNNFTTLLSLAQPIKINVVEA